MDEFLKNYLQNLSDEDKGILSLMIMGSGMDGLKEFLRVRGECQLDQNDILAILKV